MGYLELAYLFVAAIGAALFLGTGAALLTYRRTGAFPGQPSEDADGQPVPPSVGTAVVKVVLGGVLLIAGLAAYALVT